MPMPADATSDTIRPRRARCFADGARRRFAAPASALVILAAAVAGAPWPARGGEKPAEIMTRDADAEADRLREQAYRYQSLAYIEAATSLCHRMIRRHPNSPQAGEAKARLIELGNLRNQLLGSQDEPPRDERPAASSPPPADEMLRHAREYMTLGSRAGFTAAEVLGQEIIRRYPGSPEAMGAAELLIQVTAIRNPPQEGRRRPAGRAGDGGEAEEDKPRFSFEQDQSEWSLPSPEDLYGE